MKREVADRETLSIVCLCVIEWSEEGGGGQRDFVYCVSVCDRMK